MAMDGLLELQGIDGGADRVAVSRLAMRIVAQMAGSHGTETGPPRRELVQMLARAARSGDPAMFSQLQLEFRRWRISGERAMDVYIPAAVQLLGTAWHDDQITVLQATVAFARLQDLLRELGVACTADHAGRVTGPQVLLVLPQREQHTISALLAASKMRRLGVSVCIEFLAGPTEVCDRLALQPMDAVFLSLANRTGIQTCERIIRAIRRDGQPGVPIVIGGPIVALDPNAVSAIGADFVAADVGDALRSCGLSAVRDPVH